MTNINTTEVRNITNTNQVSKEVLGYVFSISSEKKEWPRNLVLDAARRNNINESIFRPITKKNAFIRSVRSLQDCGFLHQIGETATEASFQFDMKSIQEISETVVDHNGLRNEDRLNTVAFYRNAVVKFDKTTQTIFSDKQEIVEKVYSLIERKQNCYNKTEIFRFINTMFKRDSNIIAFNPYGGTYFVPEKYSENVFKVFEMMKELDCEVKLRVMEVPKMTMAIDTVCISADEELEKDLKTMEEEIEKYVSENEESLTPRKAKGFIEEINIISRRAEEYALLCSSKLDKTEKMVNLVKELTINYLHNGVISIKKPEKVASTAEEQAIDDVMTAFGM